MRPGTGHGRALLSSLQARSPDRISGLALWMDPALSVITDGAAQFTSASSTLLSIIGGDTAAPTLAIGTSDFSIGFWLYADSIPAADASIFFKGASTDSDPGVNVRLTTGAKIRLVFTDGTGTRDIVTSAATVSTATWYFVVATFTRSGLMRLYINGAADNTGSISTHTGNAGSVSNFTLGAALTGRMDSAFMHVGRVLSQSDVTYLYNAGAGLTYEQLDTGIKTNLISFWNLDEMTGGRNDSHSTNHFIASATPPSSAAGIAAGVASNGDPVKSWTCRHKGRVYSQSTHASKPTLVTSAANGHPVVRFDGTDDLLSGDAAACAILNDATGVTVFMVLKSTAATHRNAFWSTNGSSSTTRFSIGRSSTSENMSYRLPDGGTVTTANSPATPYSASSFQVVSYYLDTAAVAEIYTAGTLYSTSTANLGSAFTNSDSAACSIGAGGGVFGGADIAELLVYQRALSTAERKYVERYLGAKYRRGIS